ncbi:hypothetical protein HPB47_008287, partial [Ixodes persulcatus]
MSSSSTELYLAKDDKLRNVLRMDEIVINIEPQEPSEHGSPALKASPIPLPPRPPPRMPSAPASPAPSPTVRKHPEAVVCKSKEVSFMTELQNRLRMRALRAAEVPVPELHRSLQQQQQRATCAEMHGKGAAVQLGLLPSMLGTSQQVSQLQGWDVKFRTHAPVHRSSLDKESSSHLQVDPQSRLLKTSATSGKFSSNPSLQKCRVVEDGTPDVKELSKMTDLQSSEISVNYGVSFRRVSEAASANHAREFSCR